MTKLDLAKQYKAYYTATLKPELVTIETVSFLSIGGKGDPSGQPFASNIEALYATAYGLKFAFKEKDKDFVVAKLEGQWWYDENRFKGNSLTNAPVAVPRSEWEYRLLVRLPGYVTKEAVDKAKETVFAKKSLQLVKDVEFFTMTEGKAVQMLHVGPFDTEPQTLKKIAEFCEVHKLDKNGLHHEIYLSDFRRTAPEKLKTILREPVK